MNFAPSPAHQAVIDRVAAVARESISPRAAMYDQAGAYPRESWNDLWKHGFLAIAVPSAYGGMGLDILSYVMVLEQLAQRAPTPPSPTRRPAPTISWSSITWPK